jgi:AraC-like DNA-binding protein
MEQYIRYFQFLMIIISIITFGDVLLNFKKNNQLKLALLLIIISIAFRFFVLFFYNYQNIFWLLNIIAVIFVMSLTYFFSIVTYFKFSLRYTIVTIVFSLFILVNIFVNFFSSPIYFNVSENKTLFNIFPIKYVLPLALILILLFAFFSYSKVANKYNKRENIYFIKFHKWITYFFTFVFFSITINIFFYTKLITSDYFFLILTAGNLFVILLILFRPQFINTSNYKIVLGNYFHRYKELEIDTTFFIKSFFNEVYFLNENASAEDFSRKLKVTTEILTKYIHENYGMNFLDFVNKTRVKYFITLVNSGDYNSYTIDALSKKSGFSSRHHLYKPFKKFIGGTPSDFIRSNLSNN